MFYKMKRENLKNEVLAVKICGPCIFLGIGCTLYVINKKTFKIIYKCDPFIPYNDKIHKIEKCTKNRILIFGGKSIHFFDYMISEIEIDNINVEITFSSQVFHFQDWIIKAILFNSIEENYLSILFAHNYLCTYDVSKQKKTNVWCEERCLLYSGEILGKNENDITVFSGTVFTEILIWKNIYLSHNGNAQILHRLKGHNGVIFSVIYDQSKSLICSTSDDRSVRLWKVKSPDSESTTDIDWSTAQVYLQTTMFGHTARVWTAIVGQKTIISIGEDSQICIWSLTGELNRKIQAHNGSPIWGVDISDNEKNIVTGAGDGSVNLWNIIENERTGKILDLPNQKKMPKNVKYLENDILFVLMEKSEVCFFETTNIKCLAQLSLHERYANYCLVAVSPDKNLVALASINGFVTIYKNKFKDQKNLFLIDDKQMFLSKIFSIQFLDNSTIIICGTEGNLKICTINANGIQLERELTLPISRERWVTAAAKYENYVFCGDRAGSIFVYGDLNNPVQILHKIHVMGVQFCGFLSQKFITTGRDGRLKFYNFENGLLKELWAKNLPMAWIVKVVQKDNDYLILGFNETDFIIYSSIFNRILYRTSCGGGHRSWDFYINKDNFEFSYIRDKKVHLCKVDLRNYAIPPIMEGFHTKEILTVQPLFSTKKYTFYVSGSEDCSLKVSQLVNQNLKTILSLDGHISSIRCIDVMSLNENEKLIFSGGGRAQLKVWKIHFKNEVINDIIDLNSFMLKGTDKERRKKNIVKKNMFDVDPETRFMDIKVIFNQNFNNFCYLFLACSDGFLRILIYDIKNNTITLKNELNHEFRCILKIHCFEHKIQKEHIEIIVLTMMTNGVVHFWNIQIDFQGNINFAKFGSKKLHQCGINCYDIRNLNETNFLLATGGDDNLLKLTYFTIENKEDHLLVKILSEIENTASHCTKITGVKLLKNDRIISAGADQRFILHKFNNEKMIFVEQIFTSIPDVQGLTTFHNENELKESWCVYGCGIEIIVNEQV